MQLGQDHDVEDEAGVGSGGKRVEFVEHGDFVREGHGELVVRLDGAEDEAVASRGPEFAPFVFVGGIFVDGVVVGPVDPGGFGVSRVGYVVDVVL